MVHCIARVRWLLLAGGSVALLILLVSVDAHAQPPVGEFSPELLNPRVARPPGAALRLLERIDALAAQRNWDQLTVTADELLTSSVDGWFPVAKNNYVGLREAVNRRLAALPPEGLAAYRARVDPLAQSRLSAAVANRDEALLRQIISESFCSSAGDDALWALGDIALERGDYQAARDAWQRLLPAHRGGSALAYPDSSIAPADVQARLALVSLREGDRQRAEHEIAALAAEFPDATGRLGGRTVVYAERLRELLAQAATWPPLKSTDPKLAGLKFESAATFNFAPPAVDETLLPTATVYPAVGNGWLLFQDTAGVHATQFAANTPQPRTLVASSQPRLTGTSSPVIDDTRAFAVVLVTRKDRPTAVANKLVALDLARDGAILFEQTPAEENAIFMGPPLAAAAQVFVCELSPQQGMKASLAAFDAATGAPRWRRSLGFAFDPSLMAGSPSLGIALACDDDVLYVSTQLGMIAAFRVDDGEPLWLRTYTRVFPSGEAAVILNRTRRPNPPLVAGSRVLVATDDSDSVTALDAATGAPLWSTPLPAPDARLLAVDAGRVLLTADRLWALDVQTGKLDPVWGEDLTSGAGQGALAEDGIVWPMALSIAMVDRTTGKPTDLSLALDAPGGANVVLYTSQADSPTTPVHLIAATPTQLLLFRGVATAADGQ